MTGQSTVGEKLGFFLSGGFSSLDEKKKKTRGISLRTESKQAWAWQTEAGACDPGGGTGGAGLEGRGQVEPPL